MRVLVVGGGVSGLSVAYFLRCFHEGAAVTLVEKTARLGGWIKTVERDGYRFECGPRSLLSDKGDDTMALVHALGLEDRVVLADKNAAKRYLFLDDKLQKLPTGTAELVSSGLFPTIGFALLKDLFASKGTEDETIHSFFARRFGNGFAEKLIDPMVAGIYSGDPKSLSIRSCFPKQYQLEQEYRSIFKGVMKTLKQPPQEFDDDDLNAFIAKVRPSRMYSFKDGLQEMIGALEGQLAGSGVDLHTNTSIDTIRLDNNTAIVDMGDRTETYDHIVFTTPPNVSAALLRGNKDLEATSELLRSIEQASLWLTHLAYKDDIPIDPGFGFLVHSAENTPFIGVSYDSHIFPTQNSKPGLRLTAMMGGNRPQSPFKVLDKPKHEIEQLAVEELSRIFGPAFQSPLVAEAEKATDCIAQYTVGHEAKLKSIDADLKQYAPQVTMLGAGLRGVSVNDCIRHAHNSALAMSNQ